MSKNNDDAQVRVSRSTLRKIRIIAAMLEMSMKEWLNKAATEALEELQEENKEQGSSEKQ